MNQNTTSTTIPGAMVWRQSANQPPVLLLLLLLFAVAGSGSAAAAGSGAPRAG
eukprot:COSAG04_NODE_12193_length_665_cov_1.367491_1_plen_52_part_10